MSICHKCGAEAERGFTCDKCRKEAQERALHKYRTKKSMKSWEFRLGMKEEKLAKLTEEIEELKRKIEGGKRNEN